jgi:hypothetical protein
MDVLSSATRTAFWVSIVQGLLVLSWTVYVLFLPPLAAQAGIPAHWIAWILVADQAIFVASDWASGLFADRLVHWIGRIGPSLVAAAVISAGLFAAMPALARTGERWPLLIAIGLWACISSFLRAPAFSLLGKIGSESNRPGLVSWSLVGVSFASALGPVITTSMRQMDPRWPLGIASVALAIAGLLASRVEPMRKTDPSDDGEPVAWRLVLLLAPLTFIATFGMQLHTSFGAMSASAPAAKFWWVPVFWTGFAFGLAIAARTSGTVHALRWCAATLVCGAAALWIAEHASDAAVFALAQGVAGAAWAVALTTVLAVVLQRSGPHGLASPLGVVLSVISLAAMSRLLCSALGFQRITDWTVWAIALWLLAALGLLLHPWTRSAP